MGKISKMRYEYPEWFREGEDVLLVLWHKLYLESVTCIVSKHDWRDYLVLKYEHDGVRERQVLITEDEFIYHEATRTLLNFDDNVISQSIHENEKMLKAFKKHKELSATLLTRIKSDGLDNVPLDGLLKMNAIIAVADADAGIW
jgi:hypothetical protein